LSSKSTSSIKEIVKKLESYCAYQERCHLEVQKKLSDFDISEQEMSHIIVHLIQYNFLNEERFASVFSTSKFHQKKWGKIRIKNELKSRRISDYLINKAILTIPSEEYYGTFQILADKLWETITEKNNLKKRKKFCDFLLRKGWESNFIYEKVKELER